MTKLEELARMLRNCPVSVAELSRRSGVSRPAILDIRDGITANPGIQTVERIERALLALCEDIQPTSDERSEKAQALARLRGELATANDVIGSVPQSALDDALAAAKGGA
jgi:transcriptional regulator with XRE-family HTH domain